MAKTIIIKLTSSGPTAGPFTIIDQLGNTLATGVSKEDLISGVSYVVDDAVNVITIESTGKCKSKKNFPVTTVNPVSLAATTYNQISTACIWRHLKNLVVYNYFYGNIEPYIIEYPFAYQYQDEILQSVQDYTKAYRYFSDPDGVSDDNRKIETDNAWFNKAVLYNGQQSTGVLELVPAESAIRLPSGLLMRYDDLRFTETDKGVEFHYQTRKGRTRIYGGKVIENVCQAIARCIIAEQMLRIGKRYKVVLTVHDAIAIVVRNAEVEEAKLYVEECMRWVPQWATGLPVNCESGYGKSYGDC